MKVVRNLPEQLWIEENAAGWRYFLLVVFSLSPVVAVFVMLSNFAYYWNLETVPVAPTLLLGLAPLAVATWFYTVPACQVIFDHWQGSVRIRWKYWTGRQVRTVDMSHVLRAETEYQYPELPYARIDLVLDDMANTRRVPLTKGYHSEPKEQPLAETINTWLKRHRKMLAEDAANAGRA